MYNCSTVVRKIGQLLDVLLEACKNTTMFWREAIAVTAGILVLWAYVPYGRDIVRGRVMPARSTRFMFTLLLVITIWQQYALGAGLTLAVSIGEAVGTIGILLLSLRRGQGGWRRLDVICYTLLAFDLLIWSLISNALLALCLSILADVIAFLPVLHKTWLDPKSETPFFYLAGTLAPLLNLAAAPHLTYQIALYPAALAIENLVEVGLIGRSAQIMRSSNY